MRAFRLFALSLLAIVSLLAQPAFAANKLHLDRLDLKNSPTVRMYLSYVDGDGRAVTGRAKEDFKLILDSAEQGTAKALTTFDQLKEPINIVAVVQLSATMTDVIEEEKKGIRALANALDPSTKPKMGVLGYAADTKRLAELGAPGDAESAASNVAVDAEGVEVHMIEAVRTAIDFLNAAPKKERKLIVLFSDGTDANISDHRAFLNVAKRAQENGIIIDTIGYAPYEAKNLRYLSELARQSNGIDRSCKAASEVTGQFLNVADEIRKEYIATFELPLSGGDGKDRTFQAIVDVGGKTDYSTSLTEKLPKAVHPVVGPSKSHFWAWFFAALGGLVLILFIVWLIVREKEPEEFPDLPPVEAATDAPLSPSVSASAPQRTMALDLGGGSRNSNLGWIVPMNGKQAFKTFRFKPIRTVIGTSADCDIIIDDQFMSTRHCEVRPEGNSFKLFDLGSTNGIIVNEKKVMEHELIDNDQFRLGRTEFKFKSIS